MPEGWLEVVIVLIDGWENEKLCVFANSLLGTTMRDGGKRERSDVNKIGVQEQN